MLIAIVFSNSRLVNAALVNWVNSTGRRNNLREGVAMTNGKRHSARSGRPPLWSPGRPPVAGREERRRFWAAIASGMASADAAVAAGVPQVIGTRWFRKAGGMPPAIFGRSAKPLSGRYLSLAEREELAILRAQGAGVREIARRMWRSASTISRELRRNVATRSGGLDYRATIAQWHADRAARRPKPVKLAVNVALRTYVQDRLAGVVVTPKGTAIAGPSVSWKGRRHGPRQDRRWASAWSPEQIAHRLRLDFPHDEMMRISHEAIYQSLYIQGRGALRRELTACLRTGRALRVPRARTRGRRKAFIVPEIMISERPAEVGDRAVPGHWGGGGRRLRAPRRARLRGALGRCRARALARRAVALRCWARSGLHCRRAAPHRAALTSQLTPAGHPPGPAASAAGVRGLQRPRPDRPVVCLDETTNSSSGTRVPVPAGGRPARHDTS